MAKEKIKTGEIVQSNSIETQLSNEYSEAVYASTKDIRPLIHSVGSNIYRDAYSPSTSIRDEVNRYDYDNYRPGERIPTDEKGMIAASMKAYKKSGNGIIKNIVDLMTDFAVQGIDVAHPDKKAEQALKFWFHKVVKGRNRSELFVSLACRAANIIIKRDTAKLPLSIVRKMYKTASSPDVEYEETAPVVEKREFPVNYTFLHPLSIDLIAPELSLFNTSKKLFGLKVPPETVSKILYPKTLEEVELVKNIPGIYVDQIRRGTKLISLDPDKVDAYYYKKDDWESWAQPMIYTVLEDLKHLEKMKLADLFALDGALSQIRIWKLGDKEKNIKPSAEGFAKLSEMLMNSVAGGVVDLLWAEDLQFQEVTSSAASFLGETKYIPILNAIYTGLGIPPLFTGSSNQGSFTNNFLAIKTMIERLEALRNMLRDFWSKEFLIVSKALGLTTQPSLTFDRMTLNDESSVLTLLLQLVDRGYLSIETIQEMVGATPEIEKFRINREWKEQKNGKRPPKASPFHKPEWKETWIDDFVKLGEITPGELDLPLDERPKGEIPPADKISPGQEKKLPSDFGGRPKGKKDSTKRKSKEVKPRRSVNDLLRSIIWASESQKKISETVTPIYLGMKEKKNLRQLTDSEFKELESLKFGVLSSFSPSELFDSSDVENKITSGKLEIPEFMETINNGLIKDYLLVNAELTIDKQREIQSMAYSLYFIDELMDE